MDSFVDLPAARKMNFFDETSDRLNIDSDLIEKDFWVCWTLQQLFSLPGISENLTFKGGTSLSKCYSAIHRFSEDIDITIAKEFLKNFKDIEPAIGAGTKENRRRIEALLAASQVAISEEIIPKLREKMAKVLGGGQWDIRVDPKDVLKQSYLFEYPSVFPTKNPSSVILEFGARSDVSLVQSAKVLPYVAEVFRDSLSVEPATVRALSPERTLWEKVSLLHKLHHLPEDKEIAKRMARHYYDVYEMEKVGIFDKALKMPELLQKVVDSERLFFKRSWVDYDNIKYGDIKLIPKSPQMVEMLKNDYQSMQRMFFDSPPSFDQILSGLQKIEYRINNLEKTLDNSVASNKLNVSSKATPIQQQSSSLSKPHELMGYNTDETFINGRMNINDKELAYMIIRYAHSPMGQRKQRESMGLEPWGERSVIEKREEFYKHLQNDLRVVPKLNDDEKIDYVINKATNTNEPLQGFYQIALIKCGARIDKDGAVEISQSVKDNVLELGRRSLAVKDMIMLKPQELQYELERMNLGKSLKY